MPNHCRRTIATSSSRARASAAAHIPALPAEELADHEQAEAVLLARDWRQQDTAFDCRAGPDVVRKAWLFSSTSCCRQQSADRHRREVAAVGLPEIAEMARDRRQDFEVDRARAACPRAAQAGDLRSGAGEVALHDSAASATAISAAVGAASRGVAIGRRCPALRRASTRRGMTSDLQRARQERHAAMLEEHGSRGPDGRRGDAI